MTAEEGEQLLLAAPHDGVVMPLVYTGLDVPLFLANLEEPLHLRGGVVREPESLELALVESLVHGLGHILKGCLAVRDVEEHGLDAGGPQIGERLFNARLDLGRLMGPGGAVADLSVDGEPGGGAGFPETVLGARVVARCVEAGVASRAERVKDCLDVFCLVEMDYSGELGGVTDL